MTLLEIALSLNLVGGVGPIRISKMVEQFGSLEGIFHASERQLMTVDGIGQKTAQAIRQGFQNDSGKRELELAEKLKIKIICLSDEDYPPFLAQIYDPPIILYARGQTNDLSKLCSKTLAIVGSRSCSRYGLEIAQTFGRDIAAANWSVVSGLARGIDTAAHLGAIKTGKTLAVLGSGLCKIYPPENIPLAEKICDENGLILSEFPLNWGANKTTFPLRNRIVSGISQATIVIEAPEQSGALITAQLANEQGRSVYAVPGLANQPFSQGCHRLIRDGATLVTSATQVLEDFSWLPLEGLPNYSSPKIPQNPEEKSIWSHIQNGYDSLDLLAEISARPTSELIVLTTKLELSGFIIRNDGGRFQIRS